MRWVGLMGVAVALAGCSTFVAADSSDTDPDSSAAEGTGGQTTSPTAGSGGGPVTTGADGSNSGPQTTADPTGAPSAGSSETANPTGPGTTSTSTSDDSESIGSESATSGSGDDSSSGDPPVGCGDGIRQRDEDCDDGDADELNGCTTSCEPGPTGIVFGGIFMTALDGGSGTGGSTENAYECPPDAVLVGLQGNLTADPWLASIAGRCRPTSLTNTDPAQFETGGPASLLPEQGGFGNGDPWSTECGPNEAIVAVQGGAGDVVDGLQVRCASVDTVGAPGAYSLETTPNGALEDLVGGETGGPFGPLACPAGTVAMGLRSVTNSFVIQVELRCRELDLEY